MSRGMQWKERQEDRSQINQWNVTGGGGGVTLFMHLLSVGFSQLSVSVS